MKRVKALFLIVSLIISTAPIIYGLNESRWDLSAFFSPRYSPPRIDFRSRIVYVNFTMGDIVMGMEVENLGEIGVRIEDFVGKAMVEGGVVIANISLLKPVDIDAGTKRLIELVVELSDVGITRLASYIISGGERLTVIGKVYAKVLSSMVEFPMNMTLYIPSEVVDRLTPDVSMSIVDLDFVGGNIVLVVEVRNRSPYQINVTSANLSLLYMNGTKFADLKLARGASIGPESASRLEFLAKIGDRDPMEIFELLSSGSMRVSGEVIVYVGDAEFPIYLDEVIRG